MTNNQTLGRNIYLFDHINNKSVEQAVKQIIEVNEFDDKQEEAIKGYQRQPIKIIINSFGGSIYDGFALVSTIKLSKTPIHTICLGSAMSMGLLIFAVGHKRFAHKYTSLMYHQASFGIWDSVGAIELELSEVKRVMKQYDEILLSHTKLTQNKLQEYHKSDSNWYMSAELGKKWGIVDEVLWFD